MATTNFIDDQTIIMASWANDVNAKTYGVSYAVATGTSDALAVTIPAPPIVLTGGTVVYVAAIATNVTTTPTINVNGLGAKAITKLNNAPLAAGDIGGVNHNMVLLYNAVTTSWLLLNPVANIYLSPLVTTLNYTGGTVNLTTAQNMSTSFEVLGTLSSNLVVVCANTMAPFTVDNATTGAFTVTFKTAAGAGVVVAQGTREMLYANGTIVETTTAGGLGSGSVTSVSIVTANGFVGTVANPTTTPSITLSTGITGLLKGNGTAVSAAGAGVDYVAPGGALGTPASGTLTNCTGTAASLSIGGNAATATTATTAGVSNALKSATTSVDTSAAAAPTAGQVLRASSGTAATWTTPTGGWGF